jgi:protein-S-isoprenylcysteine O-methyltransferase Ste14
VQYIPLFELLALIGMVLVRAAMLRRRGIRAIVFGETDKTDLLLLPCLLFFLYGLLSAIFVFPFPKFLIEYFWKTDIIMQIAAITISAIGLVWFACTLKTFGESFRVGIDLRTKNELITGGTFALSRNPLYLGFLAFFTGIFLAYPNILSVSFMVFLAAFVHRQILREESFLREHYGQAFAEYCARVRRYL